MRITSKVEYYRLMEAGCLGNTLRNWRTPEEAYDSCAPLVGFREMGAAGGGQHAIVAHRDIFHVADLWREAGRRFILDEAAPDRDVLLQGEVTHVGNWDGFLGVRTGMRMRQSIAAGLLRPFGGLAVKLLLDQFLDPSSRDDFDAIWELYPSAVIEFATYPYDLGKIPGRNTLIWEVRDY